MQFCFVETDFMSKTVLITVFHKSNHCLSNIAVYSLRYVGAAPYDTKGENVRIGNTID